MLCLAYISKLLSHPQLLLLNQDLQTKWMISMGHEVGVGSMVGQPGTLSILLKVLGSKPTERKLLLGAIKLGVRPLN